MIDRVYGHVLRERDRRGTRGTEVRYDVARVLKFRPAGGGVWVTSPRWYTEERQEG